MLATWVKTLYTVEPPLTVTSLQRSPLYNGHLSTMVTSRQWSPLYNGHLSTMVTSLQRPPLYNGHLSTLVTSLQRPPLQRSPLYNSHLFTKATFLADSPYIDSCLNLSTTATFFCPQSGHCREVQLYFVSFMRLLYPGYFVFTLHGMYKEKENTDHCSTLNTRHHDKVWMATN